MLPGLSATHEKQTDLVPSAGGYYHTAESPATKQAKITRVFVNITK
jgi:hypothetical protein